ncbi:prion-inhibition and propagation-domain-containing protein [Lasiosphaeris hirsuta]|uniref:Prion-inhibition and propagation-domain-containing protein n=1 Tax=Lasiosphaeris hirsuta TaxID=260670 RepID=A0AA40AZY4_9PEZI|nr:prion-inhibition and propagation-domain-containing protein [Lasiosphaeris hirsuta]
MAELCLAIIPLCTKLLSECLHGYGLFVDAKDLGRTSQKLFWKFKIQEARLRIWAREWGLIGDEQGRQIAQLRDMDDYNIVTETLVRLSQLFQDFEQLQTRYGLAPAAETQNHQGRPLWRAPLDEIAARPRAGGPTVLSVHAALANDKNLDNLARRDLEKGKERDRTATIAEKARWAVADRSRFETMIKELQDYNDGLYCLLSSIERRRLRQALAPSVIPEQQGAAAVEDIRNAAGEYPDLATVANLAAQRLRIGGQGSAAAITAAAGTHPKLQIEGHRVVFDLSVPGNDALAQLGRALASYLDTESGASRRVLVEWKLYDKDVGEAVKQEHLQRLRELASLLHVGSKPPLLRVPRCLGFVADDWHPRIGFVFDYASDTAPWSLRHVLGGCQAVPHVGDRFRLAYQLSLSLGILHTAGWLHKGIRSENIIFSSPRPSPGTTTAPQLDEPQLVGFEYTRPNTPAAISDPIRDAGLERRLYWHPQCMDSEGRPRTRFEPALDVYALGVVLLEVGFWRRIDEFWHEEYSGRNDRFVKHLQNFYAPMLGAKMGKMYMEVVLACLSGEYRNAAGGRVDGDSISHTEGQGFHWAVVNKLSKLVA